MFPERMLDCDIVLGKFVDPCWLFAFHAKSTMDVPSVGEQQYTLVAPALWKAIVMNSPDAKERF